MNFKTVPFKHQVDEWERSRSFPTRAILWEQGTGKTKLIIDTAAFKYEEGHIDGLLVLAPNGVHENWVTDEIPTHLSDDIPRKAHAYRTSRASTKWHAKAVEEVIAFNGLAILAMSYDAFMTIRGRKAAEKFLHRRKTFYVCDESQRIKSPNAKRTRSVVASGRRAKHKRILTGTPITNSPFDIYSQLKFLDEDMWKRNGFASYEAFKTYFGVWEQRINGSIGQRFNEVVAIKNHEQLTNIVGEIGSRITKDDVLDLPPKIYTKRYFELTPRQAKLYKEVRDEFMTFLDSGEMVTAPLMIVRLLRLQQITCGYIPSDDCETIHELPDNPRMKCLMDLLEDVNGQGIIFARFRRDIDNICTKLGDQCVRYDGATDNETRLEARQRFQAGNVRWFVGNPAAAGTGLTLHAAKTVVYYSNSFNLEHRLQSEDRAHRIGQTESVRYVDIVGSGTVDSRIVGSLRNKLNIASKITGDEVRKWL